MIFFFTMELYKSVSKLSIIYYLTGNVFLCWYSDVLSKKHTHDDTYHHTQAPISRHTDINIYLDHLLCAHSSYLHYIE